MTINVNLQVTLWPGHKKHLIRAAHTITKSSIKMTGQMQKMTTMTQMHNLFNNGGS